MSFDTWKTNWFGRYYTRSRHKTENKIVLCHKWNKAYSPLCNTFPFLQLLNKVWCHLIMLMHLVRSDDTNTALLHKTQGNHKTPLGYSFLKSNSFINILQSFIHGYVIMYFFSATLQVSLFHAVWRQGQINNKQRRGLKNESLYNTFVKGQRERVSHIGTWIDLSSLPLVKKVNKRIKVGQSVGWIGVGLSVCLFGYKKHPIFLLRSQWSLKRTGGPCSPLGFKMLPPSMKK